MSLGHVFTALALLAAVWSGGCADAPKTSTTASATSEAMPLLAAYETWRAELLQLARAFEPGATLQIELDQTRADFSATTQRLQPTAADAASGAGAHRRIIVRAGLLRAAELSADGLALLLCHELGHAFGGYPFTGDDELTASEGSADYFATHVCGPVLFARHPAVEPTAELSGADRAAIAARCAVAGEGERCPRLIAASLSLAGALALHFGAEAGSLPPYSELAGEPSLTVEDTFRAARTIGGRYPSVQCRLDTLVRGALCALARGELQRAAPAQTELAALAQSCSLAEFAAGARPGCWFREGSTPTDDQDDLDEVWKASER